MRAGKAEEGFVPGSSSGVSKASGATTIFLLKLHQIIRFSPSVFAVDEEEMKQEVRINQHSFPRPYVSASAHEILFITI